MVASRPSHVKRTYQRRSSGSYSTMLDVGLGGDRALEVGRDELVRARDLRVSASAALHGGPRTEVVVMTAQAGGGDAPAEP